MELIVVALKDAKLELLCQERAKPCSSDVSAYIAAGYDTKKPGAADHLRGIFKRRDVSDRVRMIHVETAFANNAAPDVDDVTPDRIRKQLAYTAFCDILDFIEWGDTIIRSHVDEITGEIKVMNCKENWIRVKESSKIDPRHAAVFTQITRNSKGTVMSVKWRDSMKALMTLGKAMGMFAKPARQSRTTHWYPPKEPVPHVDRGPPETREQWEARVKARIDALPRRELKIS